jgi:hypothetical protein
MPIFGRNVCQMADAMIKAIFSVLLRSSAALGPVSSSVRMTSARLNRSSGWAVCTQAV